MSKDERPGDEELRMSDSESTVLEAVQLFAEAEWVDLTHSLEEGIPSVPSHARYGHTLYQSYDRGDTACHYRISMGEHTGTHVDAPLHFISDGAAHYDIASVPIHRLVGRAVTIDVTDVGPGETVSREQIEEWEAEHVPIESGDRVLFQFGWDRYWSADDDANEFLKQWPGLSADAAAYLTESDVRLVGCDTAAIDAAGAEEFPAHYELLGNETYIIENLTNLEKLPPESLLFTFPLKIEEGSGSPIRAVALVD